MEKFGHGFAHAATATTKISDPNSDLFIAQDASEACGAVSYWRAGGDISIAALRDAWIAAGLDEKLLRKEPAPEVAFRRAVLAQASRRVVSKTSELRTLVRPQAEARAWAIVEEFVEEGKEPVYETLMIAKYTDAGPVFTHAGSGYSGKKSDMSQRIMDAFGAQAGLYDSSDITNWLVKMAYGRGAVTLRDTGGVYFIPKPAMDFWHRAATVIESVTNGAHRVFRIPAMRNNEAMAAIIDAITHEAEQLVALVEQEMTVTGDDALGKRALKTRQAQASEMLKKVEAYEKLVDQHLAVRSRVEELQAAIVAVALTADTGEEG